MEYEHETALRRKNDALVRTALAATGVGAWEVDLASDRVTWSSTTAMAFGLSPEKAPATGRAFLELVHPDDRQSVRDSMASAIRDRTDLIVNFRAIASDGSVRWMEACGRVSYDVDGKAVRVLGTSTNISNRKLFDGQLQRKIDGLSAEIIEAVISNYYSKICAARMFDEAQSGLADTYMEADAFESLVEKSHNLRLILGALGAFVVNPNICGIQPHSRFEIVASTVFFLGWHARGAVEDAGALEKIIG